MEKLQVSGELSIYRAASLKHEVLGAIERSDNLEIDLAGVERLDTTAVQLLLLAKREMATKGGHLVLSNHSAPVVEVLDLYGLIGHFGDPVLLTDGIGGE